MNTFSIIKQYNCLCIKINKGGATIFIDISNHSKMKSCMRNVCYSHAKRSQLHPDGAVHEQRSPNRHRTRQAWNFAQLIVQPMSILPMLRNLGWRAIADKIMASSSEVNDILK